MKKFLIIGIIILLVGMSFSSTGRLLNDTTPPEISITWIIWKIKDEVMVDFICKVYDNESGVLKVELFYNDELLSTQIDSGPEFIFGSYPKDEIHKTDVFKFVAYNRVRLSSYVILNGSDIEAHSKIQYYNSRPEKPVVLNLFKKTTVSCESKTFYVGGNGTGNYTKIQDAINDADNGDTVFVYNGTYDGNISINKSISLIGEDRNTTIVDGVGAWNVVNVSANWVNLCNFTVRNGVYRGVLVNSDNSTLTSINIILIQAYGLVIIDSNNIEINNINSSNNHFGLGLVQANRININRNIISTSCGSGISFYYSDNNTIIGNNISKCEGLGIVLLNSSNNAIINNHITNNEKEGILLFEDSRLNAITGNNICSNNYDGIKLEDSTFNNISENIITNNKKGINLVSVKIYNRYNVISNNDICSNNNDGIFLEDSSYNNIIGNNISSNHYGGVMFRGISDFNMLTGNNISNNKYGIRLIDPCNYNIIYHNNFIENSQNAYDDADNTWDDGKYGNYWSDFEEKYPGAEKKPLKGIWNTPYEIEGGDNKDNYPLINQYPKSVIKSKSRDKLFNYNFPILMWLFERFPNAFPMLRYLVLL